jgi:hypothetical protein
LSNPIPVLEGVRDYAGFARGSEEHKLLMTRLMREKKRVCDALRDAVERIDRTLADS